MTTNNDNARHAERDDRLPHHVMGGVLLRVEARHIFATQASIEV